VTFASTLALAVGLLVLAPLLAHLLRRGRTKELEFPPAHLVPAAVVTSEQRRRLEDRLLLLLRALMVLALAVLGATPFVRCSRLSVDRPSGASVAMAIVLDDSQSMRAKTPEGARFEVALRGAEQLLGSMREGDAVAIVLAGNPARLELSTTTDIGAARRALEAVHPSDRTTDLDSAIQLARAAMKELPHADKRVVVLSDLAVSELRDGTPPVWIPLEALSQDAPNCGIASAEQQGRGVTVTVGCNDATAGRGRRLVLHESGQTDAEPLATEALNAAKGEQRIQLKHQSQGLDLVVSLSGEDQLVEDNRMEVTKEAVVLGIAVVADTARASVMTGGPTVIEQALTALAPDVTLKPLGSVPEHAEDLRGFAALIVDDPPGLSPLSRAALSEWLEKGGVALALLGPASTSTQLAATVEPFAREGTRWESGTTIGVDPKSLRWLGGEAASMSDLGTSGRVRLDAADLPGSEIIGAWDDGVPLLFRRQLGRGLVFTLGLPASVDQSDLALRPGFLALLELVRKEAQQRSGPRRSLAGSAWTFPAEARVEIKAPKDARLAEVPSPRQGEKQFVPETAGRYAVTVDGEASSRFVELDPVELTTTSLRPAERALVGAEAQGGDSVDASPEWALLVLFLFALELGARAFGDRFRRRLSPA
jgi:hypothetical protein